MPAIGIAIPAIGTLLQIGNGGSPETFNSIANIGDITGPSTSAAVVDVTSHTSVSAPWRQKIPTLLDPGTITFPMYVVPASGGPTTAGQNNYYGHSYSTPALTPGIGRLLVNRGLSPGIPYNFKIVYPDGLGTFDEFQGFVTKYSRDMKVAGVIMGSMEITLTGIPSFA